MRAHRGGFALSVRGCDECVCVCQCCVSAGELILCVQQFNDSLHTENGMNAGESANMP